MLFPARSAPHAYRPRGRTPGRSVRSRVRPTAALVVALTLAGCSAGTAAPPGDDVTLEHVHGLEVDPTDGELLAGTHHGLVRVSADGELQRIADRVQDFMGFTIVGPQHYLASGHPGEGQSGPSNLGLIETTDGGQTWSTLSLAGEADFHALDVAQDTIYGYSGGRLLVSEDGRRWEDRGAMNIADLAADPTRPQRLVVTTEDGPALSEDGGRTFTPVDGAPLLQLVAFPPERPELVGVSPEGTVYASSDGGDTWESRGTAGGPPEALGVNGADVYVAVENAIVVSSDGGATFADLYRGD